MLIEKGAKIEKDTEEEKEEEEEIEAKVETWNEMDNLESVQDWADLTKKLKPERKDEQEDWTNKNKRSKQR